MTAECAHILQWDALSLHKNCPFPRGSGPPSNTWFLGPTWVLKIVIVIGQAIIFLPCGLFLLLSIFLSCFPRLISAATDWMSTILLHMAWPQCEFRMQVWNVLLAARCKYRTQKSRQKLPSGHHRTTSSSYNFATKACIDNRKKTSAAIPPPHVLTIWWTSAH